MKRFKLIFGVFLVAAVTFTACSDNDPDPNGGEEKNEGGGITGRRPADLTGMLNYFSSEYGLSIKYDFQPPADPGNKETYPLDFNPVSSGDVFPYTVATDTAKVKILLSYLEDRVFGLFPEGVIATYLPTKIFLVDSLYNTYVYDDLTSNPAVYWERRYTLPGNVTGDYLVIGDVGARLDTSSVDFRYNLISLVVERMLFNQTLPEPNEILAVTEKVADQRGCGIYSNGKPYPLNYPYWNGNPSDIGRYWASFTTSWKGDPDEVVMTLWNGLSILNMGRIGYTRYRDYLLLGLVRTVWLYYNKGTVKQDFADFAALIFTKTPTEREALFASVEANEKCLPATYDPAKPYTSPDGRDLRFPFGGKEGADGMREKVGLVKAYFKTNLKMDLPD